jgi:hypothetical protein
MLSKPLDERLEQGRLSDLGSSKKGKGGREGELDISSFPFLSLPTALPNPSSPSKPRCTHSWRSHQCNDDGRRLLLGCPVDERDMESRLVLLRSSSSLEVGVPARGGGEGLPVNDKFVYQYELFSRALETKGAMKSQGGRGERRKTSISSR